MRTAKEIDTQYRTLRALGDSGTLTPESHVHVGAAEMALGWALGLWEDVPVDEFAEFKPE